MTNPDGRCRPRLRRGRRTGRSSNEGRGRARGRPLPNDGPGKSLRASPVTVQAHFPRLKARIVSVAQKTSEKVLIKAHGELYKKNYGNPEFAPLSAIFSQAKSEYLRGGSAEAHAVSGEGREALYYYSRAATAYTRCQALAEQVYEELVPKARAATPEDLGYDRPVKFVRFSRPPHETSW